MAGNIACGLVTGCGDIYYDSVAEKSVKLAIAILKETDERIEEENEI
jgi:hypothetical protein